MLLKKYIIFISIVVFSISITQGQIIGPNLVQNPSFEDYYQCPYSSGQLNFAKHWSGLSTEYFNYCSTNSHGVPSNWAGYQFARTGYAYAGLEVYWGPSQPGNPPFQESIKNVLIDSLKKGKRYCIDFYISLSDEVLKNAILHNIPIIYDSIGAMFSDTIMKDVDYPTPCDDYVKFSKNLYNKIDALNWNRISGSVTAKGGEKYLRIGKFYPMVWPPNSQTEFYVYVDDVSVCECAYHIDLGEDTLFCQGDTKILDATLPDATYEWQDGSTNPTYVVTQPGTYWVKAYIAQYDITTSDTIIISPEKEETCNPPLIIPNFISPNGDNLNDYFQLGNIESFEINLQIYNRWGTLLYQNAHYQNDYNCNGCADGVYYYLISAKGLRNKVVKEYHGSLTVFH